MSRILGFIRDIVIARLFGVYIYAQAFVVAFRIPNLLRDLVGEGAVNAALVPVLSEYKQKHSPKEFWELANVMLNLLLVISMVLTLLGIVFSPFLVRIMAPGFIASPEKLAATIKLNQIIFPYIILISLTAYAMGVLNSLKHFTAPAFASCLLNISIICFAMLFGEGIKGLALGVLVGGVLQLAIQIPFLYRKGFRLRLFQQFMHPAVKSVGRLMVPRLASSSIYQLNNFVDSIFGSLVWIVGEGGVAVLYFSYRLILFPLGIFSTALSQALLPTFSTQALEHDQAPLRHSLSWGLRAMFFIMLPASFGFIALSRIIIATLFEGGKFDHYSVGLTAQTLLFYSIGLFAYGGTKILQSCFFALKDTVTPTKVAFFAFIMNVILNALFMFPLKLAGIALATSVSGIATFLMLFALLKKRIGDFQTRRIMGAGLRMFLASACMALVCFGVSRLAIIPLRSVVYKFANLSFLLIIGIVSYALFCLLFKVAELGELWRWVTKRKLQS